MSRGLKALIYVVTGIFSFIVFLYFTFPIEDLTDRLLSEVERSLRGQYEITYDSVSQTLLVGVKLGGVRVSMREEDKTITILDASAVKLKTSLVSLIFKRPKFKFDVRVGDGRIKGTIRLSNEWTSVESRFSNINLGEFKYLAAKYGKKISSSMSGAITIEANAEDMTKTSGNIDFKPGRIEIKGFNYKTPLGDVEIPDLVIGSDKSEIIAELKKGTMRVSSLKIEGGDIMLDLKGFVYIAPVRLSLRGKFMLSDKMYKMPFVDFIKNQMDKDGSYQLIVTGPLDRLIIKVGDFTLPL